MSYTNSYNFTPLAAFTTTVFCGDCADLPDEMHGDNGSYKYSKIIEKFVELLDNAPIDELRDFAYHWKPFIRPWGKGLSYSTSVVSAPGDKTDGAEKRRVIDGIARRTIDTLLSARERARTGSLTTNQRCRIFRNAVKKNLTRQKDLVNIMRGYKRGHPHGIMDDLYAYYQLSTMRAMFALKLSFKEVARYMFACAVEESWHPEKRKRYVYETDAFFEFRFMHSAYYIYGWDIANAPATDNPFWVKIVQVRETLSKIGLSGDRMKQDLSDIGQMNLKQADLWPDRLLLTEGGKA